MAGVRVKNPKRYSRFGWVAALFGAVVLCLVLSSCESNANRALIDGDLDSDASEPCASIDCSPGTCAVVNGSASCDCPPGYTRSGLTKCLPIAQDGDPEADTDYEASEALDGDLELDTEIPETSDSDESESDLSEEEQCLTCFHDTGLLCNPEPEIGQAAVIVDRRTENANTPSPSVSLSETSVYYLSFNEAVSPSRPELRKCDRATHHIWTAYDPSTRVADAYRDDSYAFIETWNEESARESLSFCSSNNGKCDLVLQDYRRTYPSYHYPYFTYFDDRNSERLTVYSIPDKTTRVLQGLSNVGVPAESDGRHIAVSMLLDSIEPYGSNLNIQPFALWQVDLPTLTFRPMAVGLSGQGWSTTEKRYVVFADTRDAIPPRVLRGGNGAIYLFDMKYKRERPLTASIGRSETITGLEYPYAAFQYQEGDNIGTGGGFLEALNIETGETWVYDKTYNDDSFSWNILQDRMLTSYTTGNEIVLFKLPAAARLPVEDTCVRRNPCVDDFWSSTLQACSEIPNHDRCDDGNSGTAFDVCVAGECKGLPLGTDDAPMVTIPAGDFVFGNDRHPWEGPRRTASLPVFQIDPHEVTVGQYKKCVAEKACEAPKRVCSGRIAEYYTDAKYDAFPVLYVDWFEARNYCNWVGKRLPTEEEWVKAARGSADARDYPWGDHVPDATSREANVAYEFLGEVLDALEIMTYPKDISPYGVYDTGGNVSEWTASAFSTSSLDGPADWGMDLVVVKGGSWLYGPQSGGNHNAKIDVRAYMTPWSSSMYTGFRCAK